MDRSLDAETALDAAGDPTRLAILRALFETGGGPVSFSELQTDVELRDSGLFNYHLGKLVGPFVRKDEDGYHLRHAGEQVVGAVLAGTYGPDRSVGPVSVEGACFDCGGPLVARYVDDHGSVACADCDTPVTRYRMPSGLFDDREADALPGLLHRWVRLDVVRLGAGICPVCLGPLTGRLDTPPGVDLPVPGVAFTCDRCGMHAGGTVGLVLLDHPTVAAFHFDHGVDLRTDSVWRLDWLFDPDAVELVDEDPPTVRVTVRLDGDELTATVRGDLSVDVDGLV